MICKSGNLLILYKVEASVQSFPSIHTIWNACCVCYSLSQEPSSGIYAYALNGRVNTLAARCTVYSVPPPPLRVVWIFRLTVTSGSEAIPRFYKEADMAADADITLHKSLTWLSFFV